MFRIELIRMNPAIEQMRIMVDPHPLRRDEPNPRWCIGYAWPNGNAAYFTNRPKNSDIPQHGLTPVQFQLAQELTQKILNDPEALELACQWRGDDEARAALAELKNEAGDRAARQALAKLHETDDKPERVSVPLMKDEASGGE